jgi:hypothetical protein
MVRVLGVDIEMRFCFFRFFSFSCVCALFSEIFLLKKRREEEEASKKGEESGNLICV